MFSIEIKRKIDNCMKNFFSVVNQTSLVCFFFGGGTKIITIIVKKGCPGTFHKMASFRQVKSGVAHYLVLYYLIYNSMTFLILLMRVKFVISLMTIIYPQWVIPATKQNPC